MTPSSSNPDIISRSTLFDSHSPEKTLSVFAFKLARKSTSVASKANIAKALSPGRGRGDILGWTTIRIPEG